jgi:hypothetical protein
MPQPLSLEQLKAEAQKTHRVIQRDGESAWRPLKYWRGVPAGMAVYFLLGDRVLAKRAFEEDEYWFTLR